MTKKVTLRCQFSGGQRKTLDGLTTQSTFEQLQQLIHEVTNVPPQKQRVMFGFPPKPLDFSSLQQTLEGSTLRSGDTLIVEEGKPTTQAFSAESVTVVEEKKVEAKLVRKVVPDDNSCLFTSLSFVLLNSDNFASDMRQIAASCIESDPSTYKEAFLGKTNKEYCEWLRHKDHWGGAIEIMAISAYNGIEINVADIQTGRMDSFGQENNYRKCVFLIYNGIHYDPLVLQENGVYTQTQFDTSDLQRKVEALAIAEDERKNRQFTDLAGFSLRCLDCKTPLVGQTQAQQHAKSTGHTNFGEF